MGEKRGDVVQYIIVLAVIVVILIFAFPKIKGAMKTATKSTTDGIEKELKDMDTTA